MKQKAVVVWNDPWHPSERYAPFIEALLPADKWEVQTTVHARELAGLPRAPQLTVFLACGCEEKEEGLPDEIQQKIVEMVRGGMGILFFHAGLVKIGEESLFYKELNAGRFISHPPECAVAVTAVGGVRHPVLEGVALFAGKDEHYFCQLDVSRTTLLACGTSQHLTAPCAWAHSYGDGRVVSLTPGHTTEVLCNPELLRLTRNAVEWLAQPAAL